MQVVNGELRLDDLLLKVCGEENRYLVTERVTVVKFNVATHAVELSFVHNQHFQQSVV